MNTQSPPKRRVAIVGGGISGLVAAKKMIEAGYQVDIYEASPKRVGGKVESIMMGDQVVNAGAEFVDTGSTLIPLAESLGVKLVEAKDQQRPVYYLPDGMKISERDFLKALSPIAEKIRADKAIVAKEPNGRRAHQIDKMSVKQYLADLSLRVHRERPLPFFKYWTSLLVPWDNKNAVHPAIIETASQVYASECGQDVHRVSALQFVGEVCGDSSRFLESDCRYRIEGGTEAIIDGLKRDLESKGATFHMGSMATGLRKEGGKYTVDFRDGSYGPDYDQVMLALPMYAMDKIKGLDALGLSPAQQKLFAEGQYTHSAKFTVRLKPGMAEKLDLNAAHFTSDGYQAWMPTGDSLTFLIGGESANRQKGRKMVDEYLAKFARTHGTTVDELFDTEQVAARGPDLERPCYASPAPGQLTQLVGMTQTLDKMAAQGVGIVGTYIPCPSEGGMSVGFMECGVESVDHTAGIMIGSDRARAQALASAQPRDIGMGDDGFTPPPQNTSGGKATGGRRTAARV